MSSSHSVTVLSLLFLAMFFSTSLPSAQLDSYEVQSLDKRTTARIATGDSLTITIMHDGKTILFPSPLSLEIIGSKTLGLSSIVADAKTSEVSETITPVSAERTPMH